MVHKIVTQLRKFFASWVAIVYSRSREALETFSLGPSSTICSFRNLFAIR
jgi:hypothetical protein